ncbi:MAG: glycosyltransferase family 2 protein [Dehalococcoidales bacterium]|nr:glycosyltransferase family 2 protein [Dehalococcoidales bacterium]
MTDALISIILPTYNRAYCVGRTIDAILSQSYHNWELIICDDCSPDETQKIANFYCQHDRRVRYHRNHKRLGLPGNRNQGINLSLGNLIYFIEDDVVLEPNCLEKLFRAFKQLETNGIRVGGIGPRTFEPPKKGKLLQLERQVAGRARQRMKIPAFIDRWTGLMYQNFALDCRDVMETVLVPSWSLFDKKAVRAVGGYESSAYNRFNFSHEETDLFVRLKRSGYSLYFHPEAIAHHRHESRGGTRTSPLKYYYYYLGAHLIFLLRNFRWKAGYMIPACLAFLTFNVLRSSPALVMNRE